MNAVLQKVYGWQRDPESMPNGQVVALMDEASRLMRLTLGEATERMETRDADQRQPDFSRLTDEEIDLLHSIGKKLYG